jgi:hypothetical protein
MSSVLMPAIAVVLNDGIPVVAERAAKYVVVRPATCVDVSAPA